MIAVGHRTLDWAEELDSGDGDPRLMRSALAGFAGLAVDVVGSLEWNGRGLDFCLVSSGLVWRRQVGVSSCIRSFRSTSCLLV